MNPINIIFENEDFLVINKPAGFVSHENWNKSDAPCILDSIKNFRGEFLQVVHRLDKDTSGLLIVAKTREALSVFGTIFFKKKIKKYYLAVVRGIPKKKVIFINKTIGRDPFNKNKMKIMGHLAKDAKTEVTLLNSFDNHSVLSVEIFTGRTHQIRVHLSNVGLPVLGDNLYGQESELINRQALHAYKAIFSYKGKLFKFTVPLPDDIKDLCNKLNL